MQRGLAYAWLTEEGASILVGEERTVSTKRKMSHIAKETTLITQRLASDVRVAG
jgi:hypothetical protein